MRIGEKDIDLDAPGEDFMARHLLALIVSQRLFHDQPNMPKLAREAFQRGLGRAVAHPARVAS